MVKLYSIKTHGLAHKLSPHFSLAEFQCEDKSDKVLVSEELIAVLEQIRSWAREIIPGCIVQVTSGYRTKAHNALVHGASDSQHLYGTAADIKIRMPDGGYVRSKTVCDALNSGKITGKPFVGGIGHYPRALAQHEWTHVDMRFGNARWTA